MKKFSDGDIIYNSIKAYPKVRFFVNSGSISYNNNTDTDGNAVLFDLLRIPQAAEEQNIYLLAEDGQILLEETGTPIAPE